MKIARVQAWRLSVPLEATYWVSNTTIAAANLILVKVETDQGVTGLATLHGQAAK